MDWPGTPNAASQWPGTPVAPKQAWPGTPLAAMHDRAPLQADALHDRPPIASQPEVSGKLSFAPIGNESFAHKAVQGAASLADVARRASKAAGGVVYDFASAPFEAVQEQIKAMRQGEGLASNPASIPNAPEQAGQVAGAASMGVAETPRLAGDIPKPIPSKIEPQAPPARPTVADIPKATGEWPGTPNPVARQAGQTAVEGALTFEDVPKAPEVKPEPKSVGAAATPPVASYPDTAIKGTVKKLSDDLHRLDRKHDEVKIGALKAARELPPEAVALKQKFFEHLDPGKKPALSTEEKSIFRRTLAPWLERQQDLYAEIRRLAPSLLPKDFDPDYVHHLVKGRVPEFDQPLGEMSREGTYPYQGGKKLPRSTRSLQSSRYYAIEDAKGNRRVAMLDDKGNLYLMQGKKPVNVPAKDITGEVAPGKTVSIGGKDWTLKRASVAEKESATNLKYYKDAYAATLSNVVRLEKVADALHFFETMKKDPEFLEGARRPGDNRPTPAEWRTTTLPGWEGWRFEPRLAEVMDDWHDKPGEAWSENLKQLNHAVLGSLFLLPFRHMGNVGAHYYVGRGWDWLSAPAWVNMAKDTTAAIMDVAKQGPMTRAMLKEGSALQYPRVANQDFYGQMLKSLGEDMKAGKYDSIFQRVGIKPKEFYDGWLKASSAAMWAFNDVLMQSRVRELMHKGMSMGDAIRVAEKDIPNYRINSRVMMDNKAGRAMSRYLQNSLFSAFGRYNNNKWRAIADMAADIAKGNPKERMDAVGKFVALASLVYFLMWPLDAAIKKLTGDKNKRSSPIGPASVVDELKQGAELLGSTRSLKRLGATDDQVDASQLFQSMIELSPLAEQVMTQTTGHNPYTGQDVKTLGERAQSVAGEIDPLAIGSDIASGRETPTEEILKSTIGERSVRHPPPPRVQTQQERAREKAESRQPINRLVSGGERKLRPFTPDAIVNWLLHQGPGP